MLHIGGHDMDMGVGLFWFLKGSPLHSEEQFINLYFILYICFDVSVNIFGISSHQYLIKRHTVHTISLGLSIIYTRDTYACYILALHFVATPATIISYQILISNVTDVNVNVHCTLHYLQVQVYTISNKESSNTRHVGVASVELCLCLPCIGFDLVWFRVSYTFQKKKNSVYLGIKKSDWPITGLETKKMAKNV